ncbi:hypothetical protein OCU04_012169 [Sclerotinia nivalis]|uniref:Uncharacterized protein n=1 Tax=Sclerotinia nivalis TaxID=352851 RepID=A0A9X0ABL1_9HELO|nr:hypothetical protein OCU04_012169 [Sclerotinia nivalis]
MMKPKNQKQPVTLLASDTAIKPETDTAQLQLIVVLVSNGFLRGRVASDKINIQCNTCSVEGPGNCQTLWE